MYHAIVHDIFVKDKTFFKKYPIVKQKADQGLIAHVISIQDPQKFIQDLQKEMIDNTLYCCPLYDDCGNQVKMVFKNIICPIDPKRQNVWEEATDYISEITKTPCWHNYSFPQKISDESEWLHTNNEIDELVRK